MKTFFELCDELTQTEVARRLKEPISTLSRCYRAEGSGVRPRIIEKCVEVFGDEFDRDRTILDWMDKVLARRAAKAEATVESERLATIDAEIEALRAQREEEARRVRRQALGLEPKAPPAAETEAA